MREVKLPTEHRPYVVYHAKKDTRRKPTAAQQRILDQMREGVWYECEIRKDWHPSCLALVDAGWCEMARVARKDKDGQLRESPVEEMLLDAVFGRFKEQPVEMYRLAVRE